MHLRPMFILSILLLTLASANAAPATPPVTPTAPTPISTPGATASTPAKAFDVEAATRAYLDRLSPAQKARSDAYFEGGYWLQLWDLLAGVVIYFAILATGLSAKMRDLAERITKRSPLRTMLYWVQFSLVLTVVFFPLNLYENYFREHQYGLATQNLGGWLGDFLKASAVNLVFGAIAFTILYGVVRKAGNRWWLWGTATSMVILSVAVALGPVYINPMFNTYTKLTDPKVRGPILTMARANGITAEDVYVMDASRQTNRMSANVSGFLGTQRITLNDNLLRRADLPEIESVMGHEMGHYALNHIPKSLMQFGLLIAVLFAVVQWSSAWALARWGERWRARSVGDLAALPLMFLLFTLAGFLATPVFNTIVRTQEAEADIFGLNAARQPDGFAEAALHLSEYRKMEPGPIEEWIFFDHPSGKTRIHMAMRWKAENLGGLGQGARADGR